MAARKKTIRKNKAWTESRPLIISIVAVIVVLALLIIFNPQAETIDQPPLGNTSVYNNFEFTQLEGLWYVRMQVGNQPYRLAMHYHPQELEDIPIQENLTQSILRFIAAHKQTQDKQAYISVRPDASSTLVIAGVEIAKVMGERYGIFSIPTRSAISRPMENLTNYPVVTCWDSDPKTIVFWIKEEGDNMIVSPQRNCIVLQGTNATETVRVADRLVYTMLGIMPEKIETAS